MLIGACRFGVLGLMGTGAAGTYVKRRRLIREGKCTGSGLCTGCEILASCDLPRALSAKEDIIGGDNAGK